MCISDDSALVLLRDTILVGVMEKEWEVVRQGTAYSDMVTLKTRGMLAGLFEKENEGGLELSMEIEMLFKGTTALASVKHFMPIPSNPYFRITSCKDKSEKGWQLYVMSELVMAWKQFSIYYEYIPCSNKLRKVLNSKSSQLNFKERMDIHLDSYERFLKPIAHQLDLGNSYAKILAVYYYFQFVHQFSRIFAGFLTSDQVGRLERAHMEFIENTDLFLSTITLQRTNVGSFPFEGRWLYNNQLGGGILVPSNFNATNPVAQYKTNIPFQKVSLYRVNLEHEQKGRSLPGCIYLLVVDQKYLELTIHTIREDWDEVWLGNLVMQMNNQLSTQEQILEMIYS